MSSVAKGSDYSLVRVDYGFSTTGADRVEYYEGTRTAIENVVLPALRNAGAVTKVSSGSGAKWTCEGSWSNATGTNGGTVDPSTDRWEVVTEMSQFDLRAHPAVVRIAGTEDKLNQWWKDMDDAIRNGQKYSDVVSSAGHVYDVNAQKIFNLRCRGVDSFERNQPILRRIRTISPRYTSRVAVTAAPTIYTTNKLVSTWSIPVSIQTMLPSNPVGSIPPDTMWGWLLRNQTSTYVVARNQIEEQTDWQFTLWTTLLYNIVS